MTGLRITGGTLRGRRLKGRGGPDRRPTSERVREAIFSILTSRDAVEGARVYDLFAGTGALGFEALSRGAQWALFVDHDRRTLQTITEDIASLGLAERASVQQCDLRRSFSTDHHRATLVLLDPPYTQADLIAPLLQSLAADEALAPGAWIAIETAQKQPVELPDSFISDRVYRYGDTRVTLARFEAS